MFRYINIRYTILLKSMPVHTWTHIYTTGRCKPFPEYIVLLVYHGTKFVTPLNDFLQAKHPSLENNVKKL